MCVVCAGAKSILDIGLTLEFLETQGVCVAAWQSDMFPAFYTRSSGHRAPARVESAVQAAGLVQAARDLGLQSGLLVAVPIPEQEAAAGERIETAIQQAVGEAASAGVTGRALTPHLLARLTELTAGESLTANLALVRHNARVGTEIAVAVAEQRSAGSTAPPPARSGSTAPPPARSGSTAPPPARTTRPSGPLVVGGCNQAGPH